MKEIIYILGSGRSGSTLLDIMLGNGDNAFSCGELRRLPFHRGRAAGVPENSDCGAFWRRVSDELARRIPGTGWDEWDRTGRMVEYHTRFLAPWRLRGDRMARYRTYVNTLFDILFDLTGKGWLIDSSKYPGRLLSLLAVSDYPVSVIWLVRHPVGVVNSFSRGGIEQPRKGFLAANTYYGINSLLCVLAWRRAARQRKIRIRYEDLVRDPATELARIAGRFGIDLSRPIRAVTAGEPLRTGCLADGNRIRLLPDITVRTDDIRYGWTPGAVATRIINRIWY